MDFTLSPQVASLVERVRTMVRDEIIPAEEEYMADVGKAPSGDRFEFTPRQIDIREIVGIDENGNGLHGQRVILCQECRIGLGRL